jgi:NAD(P)H-hydrate epimerase
VGATPVLAVDIPSGVSGLTGQVSGGALAARRTVTFAALKPGLLLAPGRALAGDVEVADIGLDTSAATAGLVTRDDVAAWLPDPAVDRHKWKAGVLVVAGSPGMGGAAQLTAGGAQRAGAGMVRLGSPGLADPPRPLEAVGLELPAEAWSGVVVDVAHRFGALVVGPGLGRVTGTFREVADLLRRTTSPVVVDGDALTLLADRMRDVIGHRRGAVVLTPHDGEFETLYGSRPGPDRLAAARHLATATGAVVLLKGPITVVADPNGETRVVDEGDERLGTAGTGDVLSGVIGALLAQGLDPLEAGAAGAWLHARAGRHGPRRGLVAHDLITHLPAALADVSPGAR